MASKKSLEKGSGVRGVIGVNGVSGVGGVSGVASVEVGESGVERVIIIGLLIKSVIAIMYTSKAWLQDVKSKQ